MDFQGRVEQMVFEERDFVDKFRRGNIEEFQSYIESYDQEMTSYLIANGWKCKNKAERTVLFTFGEVRIREKR